MDILLWTLLILGAAVIVFACGVLYGFILYGRGQWRQYFEKFVPPQTAGHIAVIIKQLVEDGALEPKHAEAISQAMWDDATKQAYSEMWQMQHERAVASEADKTADAQQRELLRRIVG
jgi:hypothetical protein